MALDATLHLVKITPTTVEFSEDLQPEYLDMAKPIRYSFCYWSPKNKEDEENQWGHSMVIMKDSDYPSPDKELDYEAKIHGFPLETVRRISKQFYEDKMDDIGWAFVSLEEYKNRSARYGHEPPFWDILETYMKAHDESGTQWLVYVSQDQPNF